MSFLKSGTSLLMLAGVLLFSGPGFGAILINSDRDLQSASRMKRNFDDILQLHHARKMGVGFGLAGQNGLAGVTMQMNFALDVGFYLGFGAGRGYESFNLGMKQLLSSSALTPYFGFGYARWNGRGHELDSSSPAILKDKFLSHREIATGEFTENLIYPSFGLQLYQTSGDWTGSSVYAEVLYLVDIDGFAGGATGGLGFMYFF